MKPARYTVQRCKRDETRYGPVHESDNATVTRCGCVVDESWYIVTNDFDGKPTCRKCLKEPKP